MLKDIFAITKKISLKLALAFALFVVALSSFVAIADEVGEGETLPYDRFILASINQISNPTLDAVFVFLTDLGGAVFIAAISALLSAYLLYKRKKYQALVIVAGVGGATLTNLILKILFERARPALWDHLVVEASFSFPSGHAMASSALAFSVVAILWYTKWRTASITLAVIYIVIIGLSRLYLGVHYPTDIVGGWLISLAWVMAVAGILYRRLRRKGVASEKTNS